MNDIHVMDLALRDPSASDIQDRFCMGGASHVDDRDIEFLLFTAGKYEFCKAKLAQRDKVIEQMRERCTTTMPYPADVFIPPTKEQMAAVKALPDGDMIMTRLSADMGRRVYANLLKELDEALENSDD